MILQRIAGVLFGSAMTGALVLGAMTLSAPNAEARGPIVLQCGPTSQWSCTGVGGPSYLFVGTVCLKNRYERKTGRTCVRI